MTCDARVIILQAWRAQRDPQSIDPELRKMLAAPEAGRAANTDPAAASSYEPRHLLKYIAVVAGAGFIAGEVCCAAFSCAAAPCPLKCMQARSVA